MECLVPAELADGIQEPQGSGSIGVNLRYEVALALGGFFDATLLLRWGQAKVRLLPKNLFG